jgi:hypothetical protein
MSSKPVLHVAWATHEASAHACKHWHYSRCMPAGKLVHIGVWENEKFIGVVLFGYGANQNIGVRYHLQQVQVCELVRIALTAHESPVSKIAAQAIRMLRRQSPGLRLIVSYADPVQGHHGGIYQAGNWLYVGNCQPQRTVVVDGVSMHKRSAFSKYGTASPEQISRMSGSSAEWSEPAWKHTYLMPLDDGIRTRLAPLVKPYPKRETVSA